MIRSAALAQWTAFLPQVPRYASERNHVTASLSEVSRLSAAFRHRLLTEDEVIAQTLATFSFQSAEKWLQEVCWRRHWKAWLHARPGVWSHWKMRVIQLRAELSAPMRARVLAAERGETGVECMDAVAKQLVMTGYLHNHARMWWASFWIHEGGLPWELGADFFYRHLLDADPASNTLSWRWVAGLQTPGKAYIVRLSNVENYASTTLAKATAGSERIADGVVLPHIPANETAVKSQPIPVYDTSVRHLAERVGLWLHGEDLTPETGPLAVLTPVSVLALAPDLAGRSRLCRAAVHTALLDACARAVSHYACEAVLENVVEASGSAPNEVNEIEAQSASCERMCQWAVANQLAVVVTSAPPVGPTHDWLARIEDALNANGIRLVLVQRPSDAHANSLSSGGFFPFWEKMSHHLRLTYPKCVQ